MPSSLAQLPAHRTSSSPIWLPTRVKRWSGWRTLHRPRPGRNVSRASSGWLVDPRWSKHHKLLPLWHLSTFDEAPELRWYKNKSVLASNQFFNAGGRPSVSVLPLLNCSHPVHLWPMPCASTGPSWSWLQQQPDWRRGNLVGGCGWSVWEIWDRIWSEVLLLNLELLNVC